MPKFDSSCNNNVQFPKITIPTPWNVNGNSKGCVVGGALKSQKFERKVWRHGGLKVVWVPGLVGVTVLCS